LSFLVRRINVNRHSPSAYVFLLWFHDSDHWFYVSGVFYLKNNFLARPRLELATARNTFQHKNTKLQPSVLGYSTSWKVNNQLPISIFFLIWSISKDVGSMFFECRVVAKVNDNILATFCASEQYFLDSLVFGPFWYNQYSKVLENRISSRWSSEIHLESAINFVIMFEDDSQEVQIQILVIIWVC
jgi:hypothetical protein